MSHFRQVDRAAAYLLPPSVDEWLPADHLARFVVEIVEQLDLSKLANQYRGSGSAAYHPQMLAQLLIYGYATGTYSSRMIERACYDSIAFRYVAANTHPDHDTLCSFRRHFLPELEQVFVQVLAIAQQMQLLKLGTIALDGTKLHANASRHSALSYARAGEIEQRLQDEVTQLLARAEQSDQSEAQAALDIPGRARLARDAPRGHCRGQGRDRAARRGTPRTRAGRVPSEAGRA